MAVDEGELGDSAKVSLNETKECHLICIYCADFSNEGEVRRVLTTLMDKLTSEHEESKSVIRGFKPDIFTDLNIYSQNEHGLSCTIHRPMLQEEQGRRELR